MPCKKRYAAGDRDPAFLYQLAFASYEAGSGNHSEIAHAYLDTQEDWSLSENMEVIFMFVSDTEGKLFAYLTENRSSFDDLYGPQNVDQRLEMLIIEDTFNNDEADGETMLAEAAKKYQKIFPEDAELRIEQFKMAYYQEMGEFAAFADQAIRFYEKFPTEDAYELNNIAWTFFEFVEDKEQLNQAIALAQKSVALEDAHFNNDTLAWLYFKTGNKEKALEIAEKAIALGKREGTDVSLTESLVEQIKAN